MAKSLDRQILYPFDGIVYSHFLGNTLDYHEIKTLITILWIINQ
jgi:hypothetical protein